MESRQPTVPPRQRRPVDLARWPVVRMKGLTGRAGGPLLAMALVLAFIWILFSISPEESAWHFNTRFKVFYSIVTIIGSLFFMLLNAGPMPAIRSPIHILGSILLVYLLTVGALVGVGASFPQFEKPKPAGEITGGTPAERGGQYFRDPNVKCYRCHIIAGSGGKRGPDLTEVGKRAGTRKSGMSAEEYLRQSIMEPKAFVVPEYDPLMPTDFAKRVTATQINDIVQYLLTLK